MAEAAASRGNLEAFDYISTVMVAGKRRGLIGEEELDDTAGFFSTYEQSKSEAEQLVRSKRGNLPVSVFRLSMVVGDSRTGHTSTFNVMYWPLKMLSRGMFWIVPADPNGVVDVVPVDYVADAVEALSGDPQQRGKSFHIAAGAERLLQRGRVARSFGTSHEDPAAEAGKPEGVFCVSAAIRGRGHVGEAPRGAQESPRLYSLRVLRGAIRRDAGASGPGAFRAEAPAGEHILPHLDRIRDCDGLGQKPVAQRSGEALTIP